MSGEWEQHRSEHSSSGVVVHRLAELTVLATEAVACVVVVAPVVPVEVQVGIERRHPVAVTLTQAVQHATERHHCAHPRQEQEQENEKIDNLGAAGSRPERLKHGEGRGEEEKKGINTTDGEREGWRDTTGYGALRRPLGGGRNERK